MPFRNLKARMFYSKAVKGFEKREETPKPFCEFRVWMITGRKVKFPKRLFNAILNKLEYIFFSMRKAREQNAIYFIEGKEENVRIDRDEALYYLARTGVRKPRFGEAYRQVHFWLVRRRERVYNEADIRRIEGEVKPEPVWRMWRRSMIRRNVFRDDVTGLSWDKFMELVG